LDAGKEKTEGNFFFLSKEENFIGIPFSGGVPVLESFFLFKNTGP
jgi:hypothetical protein